MPAFNYTRYERINDGLRMMYYRSIAYKRMHMSYKAARKLFLDPEHYELIEKAKTLFTVYGEAEFNFSMDGAKFRGNINSAAPKEDVFPFPSYMGKKIFVADEEDPTLKKLREWVAWRVRIARDFTLAATVLSELNHTCASPRVLNYLWPSIVPVMRMQKYDDGLQKLAMRLSETKTVPAEIPGFSPEFKAAANEAAGVVARTQMLSAEHDEAALKKGHIGIELSKFDMACPWNLSLHLPTFKPLMPVS